MLKPGFMEKELLEIKKLLFFGLTDNEGQVGINVFCDEIIISVFCEIGQKLRRNLFCSFAFHKKLQFIGQKVFVYIQAETALLQNRKHGRQNRKKRQIILIPAEFAKISDSHGIKQRKLSVAQKIYLFM